MHEFAGFGDLWVMQWSEGSSKKLKVQCKPYRLCNFGVKIIEVDREAPTLVLKISSGS